MSSDGTPDRGSLTPQEWNRLTESLVSLSAVVTNTATDVLKASNGSNEGATQGDHNKSSQS
jgi:hypothetical protein